MSEIKVSMDRKAAIAKYLASSPRQSKTQEEVVAHYKNCKNLTYWLGANGTVPKHTLQYLPLPEHPATLQKPYMGCPGCEVALFAKCMAESIKDQAE